MSSTTKHINIKINSIDKTKKKVGQIAEALTNANEAPTLLCTMQLLNYHTTDGVNIIKGKPNGKNRKPVVLKIRAGINEDAVKMAFGLQSLAAFELILDYGKEKYQREITAMEENAKQETQHDQTAAKQLEMNIPIDHTTAFMKNY